MSEETALNPDQDRDDTRNHAEELKAFAMHLGVFLIVILGLFLIDIATGPNWWFFYPAIAWGIGLAIHGWTVLTDQIFDERRSARRSQRGASTSAAPNATTSRSELEVIDQSTDLIDRMRRSARRIPNQDVRQQALGLCASADQVLAVIEEKPDESAFADDFLNRYLVPANAILSDYSRLANRNVASAKPTLEKVESHDIPLLSSRIDELYDRLHRGNLIDLEVAREMLSLDIAEWDDTAPAVPKRTTNA